MTTRKSLPLVRSILFSLLASLAMHSTGYSQGSPNSRAAIRSDYQEVGIVAHIRVTHTDHVEKIGGYAVYRVTGQVLELFKGHIESGEPLVYYMQVEDGYDMKRYVGEKIVFIYFRQTDETSDYRSLENSDRQPTRRVTSILRSLRRSAEPTKRTNP
jgi:hypothetical protein